MKITFDALTLAPAVIPGVMALLVLVADVIVPNRPRLPWVLAGLGLSGGVGAIVALVARGDREPRTLCTTHEANCYWVADKSGLALQALALISAIVIVILAGVERGIPRNFSSAVRAMLLLSATAGCVAVVAARDLGSWLVTIELATLPSVALVALHGGRRALHGSMTLLVTALASFAIQVLGAAMWFAATGSAGLTGNDVLAAYNQPHHKPLVIVAVMLLFAGIGFKLSLAPFHAWTPEAFAGAGPWVAGFLATTSKVGALGGMLVILRAIEPLGAPAFVPLAIIAALSMTVGNVMAFRQDDTLRLMAWSTVAQAGWVVLPMTAVAVGSVGAAGAYLALYTIGTLAVFVVMAALHDSGRAEGLTTTGPPRGLALDDVRGLFRSHPLLAGTAALGLLALAGLPPSIIGVVAKIVALGPAVKGGVWWLVIIAIINAVLGVAVYLRWIIKMLAPAEVTAETGDNLPRARRPYAALAAVMSLIIIVTSIAPGLLLSAF